MKAWFAGVLVGGVLGLSGCGAPPSQPQEQTLTVGASAVPHAEILEVVKPQLEREGIRLQVRIYSDYLQPDEQLAAHRIDANFFQTEPYLAAFNAAHRTDLVPVVGVHIEPFGAYSRRLRSLADIRDGAEVAIPDDPSNRARALILLDKAGLIALADPRDAMATLEDVKANPHHLQFREADPAQLPRLLDHADLVLVNTNYALDADLDPTRDALAIEDKESPYVNYLVARADNRDDPRIQKLAQALTSPAVRIYIEKKYHGAVLPAF